MVYDTVIALSIKKNVFNLRKLESKAELEKITITLVVFLTLFSCLLIKNITKAIVAECFLMQVIYNSFFICYYFYNSYHKSFRLNYNPKIINDGI